jgi:hypothetical protein
MGNVLIKIGTVIEVENEFSKGNSGGLRIRAKIDEDKRKEKKNELIPWAFPLLPKSLQIVPKEGEAVLLIADEVGGFSSGQRYYIGPLISQPQFNTFCPASDATTLLNFAERTPLPSMKWNSDTDGAFPDTKDVALIGRGSEDVTLKYDDSSKTSEVDIRAGIRGDQTNESLMNGSSPVIGHNIIFNGADPAYIQLKYKKGIATGSKKYANSLVNIVADRINIMSNRDSSVSHDIHEKSGLVKEVDSVMDRLHQVPKGDVLLEFLNIVKGAILHHVHPWASMEQAGDKPGYINQLKDFDLEKILSEYVRIS